MYHCNPHLTLWIETLIVSDILKNYRNCNWQSQNQKPEILTLNATYVYSVTSIEDVSSGWFDKPGGTK